MRNHFRGLEVDFLFVNKRYSLKFVHLIYKKNNFKLKSTFEVKQLIVRNFDRRNIIKQIKSKTEEASFRMIFRVKIENLFY
jgi:hypothetical protein